MAIEWIISDIDGCLSPESSEPWDLDCFAVFAARVRAAQGGDGALPPMTLCTGRPQPYAEVLMKLLDVRVPAICESGAVFYTLADNHARFAPGVTPKKLEGLRALRSFIEREILPAHSEAVLQFGKEAQLSVFSKRPELFAQIQPRLEEFVAAAGGLELDISASHYYLNISLKGVDKGAAIRELLRDLGVAREQAAGIGDTVGDLPLREAVGYFACPSNSHQEIKDVADYVSPYPQLRGMLDILDRPELRRR